MLLIKLVRLRRALVVVITTFDPIGFRDEFEVRLGDADTGTQRKCCVFLSQSESRYRVLPTGRIERAGRVPHT